MLKTRHHFYWMMLEALFASNSFGVTAMIRLHEVPYFAFFVGADCQSEALLSKL